MMCGSSPCTVCIIFCFPLRRPSVAMITSWQRWSKLSSCNCTSTRPSSNLLNDKKSLRIPVRLATADFILPICFSLLGCWSSVVYLPMMAADDSIEVSGVRNSWEAIDTNLDLSSLSSFSLLRASFSSASCTLSLSSASWRSSISLLSCLLDDNNLLTVLSSSYVRSVIFFANSALRLSISSWAFLTSVRSWITPVKITRSLSITSLTASLKGNSSPLLVRPWTSLPIPIIRGSLVSWYLCI